MAYKSKIPRFVAAVLLHVLAVVTWAPAAFGDGQVFLVLGVIASQSPGNGVALMKSVQGGETLAVRDGQRLGAGVTVRSITRDFVLLDVYGHTEKVKVGEQVDTAAAATAATHPLATASGGLERVGNTVRLSSTFRDQVVKGQLSQIMMQAAAVPDYANGELIGFTLKEIDKGSVFEQAGFVDGDVVTAIDGQRLSDVGRAIRVLQSLKTVERAEVTFVRGGAEQTVQIVVQ
jgi:general secretion pathway protein C